MHVTLRRMEATDWAGLSDDELMEKRISQLGLKLDGTRLQPLIRTLLPRLMLPLPHPLQKILKLLWKNRSHSIRS